MKIMIFSLFMLLAGCASWTTEYWQGYYENMTPEEIETAKERGGELFTVCDLTDCVFVWIY